MEKCPTEIHAYIFELACTDGGAAGIALSAVSRYVRAISAPYQWYTLAVAGTTQTVRLAERIRSLSQAHSSSSADSEKGKGKGGRGLGGPEITHLFVSNRCASRARELRYQEMGATRDMAERRRIEAEFNAEADAWARAVRVLFAYAAPTLRTLAMMCYDIHVSPNGRLFFSDLKRYRFPRLAELSIRGGFDTRLRDHDSAQHVEARMQVREPASEDEDEDGGGSSAKRDEQPTLPALRRLHLASPISFDLFLQRLRPLAPGLTHVRLSELLAFDYDMARALHSELAERGIVPARLPRLRERQWSAEPRAVPVDWDRFLPPPGALQRLVVQPAQLPPAPEELCGCCSGYYRVDDMTRLLREMAREALVLPDEEAPVYVFLPPGPRHNAYGFREGYRDWLGRAVGERGCWKEQGEVDIDAKALAAGGEGKTQSWDVVGRRSVSRWF
ncbi:hypothetical protein EI94DRAFT_1748945 [Lactarius quietus]|nr:hypothetical protein EI94DRAFT_1748945 [Lactarius quietus]